MDSLDYRKTSTELVYDLINRDNPQLPVKLTPSNCRLGTPSAITGQGFRNTQIAVMPKDGSGYMGTMLVTYRRLTMLDLFKAGYPIIDNYLLPADYGSSGAGYISITAALRWVNDKYGTALVASDADRIQLPNGVMKGPMFNFPAGNPAWIGSFYWDRRAAKKPVSEQIPAEAPALLTFVSGQPSGGSPDNIGDFATYQVDFSKFKDLLTTFTTLQALPVNAAMRELVTYMGIVSGRPLSLDVAATIRHGMQGARIIRYALPNANVPEANSTDYNNVAVIAPVAGSGHWFVGRFLLHYKT